VAVLGASALPDLSRGLPWPGLAASGRGPAAARGAAGSPAGVGSRRLPGLGRRFLDAIPGDTRQVLLVEGDDEHSAESTATLWSRDVGGQWSAGPAWPAHNALRGWTFDHWAGDLRTPIGVFSLTDAGGLAPDPGTRLPYDRSSAFRSLGEGFEGESLEGAFDHVIAIDYNHVPGTSPLDRRLPLGSSRGAGLWVHVDHQGPTHGCVTLRRDDMVDLLRALDPAAHPVIAMGDRASLAD
jgi:L,D-peptidoglycan transpeptidase YkuD (ErfK/YbiS/YcfS/YnhG family)